jgi:O-antigen ligase
MFNMLPVISILLGLAITPFTYWVGFDTREPKIFMAICFALVVIGSSFYKNTIKPFRNYWLLILMVYLFATIYQFPKISFELLGVKSFNFWHWQGLYKTLVFFIMLVVVSGIDFTKENINIILRVMIWTGCIMSLYALFQACGIDQFYKTKGGWSDFKDMITLGGSASQMGGTLGTPILLSSFLSIIVPMALCLHKNIIAALMIFVIYLSNSMVALIACFISVMAYLFFTGNLKQKLIIYSIVSITCLISVLGYVKSDRIKSAFANHSRFGTWGLLLQDIAGKNTKENYAFTGKGMGNFHYFFHAKHKNDMIEAHNDYLEFLSDAGIIGLLLLLAGIWFMVKLNIPIKNNYRACLLCSFLASAICAGGLFIWQMGAHIFYTVVIAGLLHNKGEEHDD